MSSFKRVLAASAALATLSLGACATVTPESSDFPLTGFAPWTDAAPEYQLSPGDEVELTVYSAPQLSRTLVVAPDGRINPPLVAPIMAAGRTALDVETSVQDAMDAELASPDLDLRPITFASQRVFVGGEVNEPGVYEIPGQIGALEAILLAGGFEDTAELESVVILRRGPDGATMAKLIDLDGMAEPGRADTVTLQRFDVVFVPRSGIANWNLFIQQFVRDALPIDFGFYYGLGNN